MSQSVTTTGIAAHIAVIDGQPTTTTQDIADVYGKRHDDVLRIIRQRMAECPEEWCLRNFAETETERPSPLNGAPIKSPVIRMTKKGFHFVVGKFTGIKAVQHQIAFADEFERMEQTLSASDRITPAQCQHLKELAQLVVESGKQGHAETWSRFCRKFKINKYELLPPKQFDAACKYLQGKMDGESIAALVKKHYPAAVAALPAPEASIDVKALLLGGQNAEPVELPRQVQEAINKQAWALAHDAYELLRQSMVKRMYYDHTKGIPSKIDTAQALADIKTVTLGSALAHTAHREMRYAMGSIRIALHAAQDAKARLEEQMAELTRQHTALGVA